MSRCDDDRIKPVALYTDGYEFHCHPFNRLADDMLERRAIIDSGKYHVWSGTWNDLDPANADHVTVCQGWVADKLQQYANATRSQGKPVGESI